MNLVFQKLSDFPSSKQLDLFEKFSTQEPDYIESFIKNELNSYEGNHLVHTKVLIDEEADKIVGFFSLTTKTVKLSRSYKTKHSFVKNEKLSEYPAIDINYLAVDSSYQSRGLGRTLMQLAFEAILETVHEYVGASVVTLTSLDSAIGFYNKIGFEEAGHGGMKNDHLMLLSIPEIETLLTQFCIEKGWS